MDIETLKEAAQLIRDRAKTLTDMMYPGEFHLEGIEFGEACIIITIRDYHHYAEPSDTYDEFLGYDELLLGNGEFIDRINEKIAERKAQEEQERIERERKRKEHQEERDRKELERLKKKLGEV